MNKIIPARIIIGINQIVCLWHVVIEEKILDTFEGQTTIEYIPSCGKQALSVCHSQTAYDHTGIFFIQKGYPCLSCTG